MRMDHLDAVSTIVTALGPVATGILGLILKRSDAYKRRKLEELAHQIGPNDGASLRDAVDRIEANTTDLATTVRELAEQVAANTLRIEAIEIDRSRWLARINASPRLRRRLGL